MNYLLDTNIISETIKPKPHNGVVTFLREIQPERCFLSVLTLGEIRKGIAKLHLDQVKYQRLQLWMESDLLRVFNNRILPINIEVADKWGYLLGSNKNTLPAIDSLIAATALCFNLTLVTRNTADFSYFPIEILDPFTLVSQTT